MDESPPAAASAGAAGGPHAGRMVLVSTVSAGGGVAAPLVASAGRWVSGVAPHRTRDSLESFLRFNAPARLNGASAGLALFPDVAAGGRSAVGGSGGAGGG